MEDKPHRICELARALKETGRLLPDRQSMEAIEAGLDELDRGEWVTLEQVRDELARRREPDLGAWAT